MKLDPKTKNIIFDFGGVLIDWNPRHMYRKYFKEESEMEYFLANICTTAWNEQNDAGRPFAETTAELSAQFPEYAEPIKLFYTRWEEMLGGLIQDNVDLLYKLKDAGYKLYGLTNWSAETLPIAYKHYDFFSVFEGIVVSGEEHLIKPDPRIFQVLLKRYNLTPEECLFIDDNQYNVDASINVGIPAINSRELSNLNF